MTFQNDIEKKIVAQGNSIYNDTVGPTGWTDETPEDRKAFEQSLRPVDRQLLEKALPHFHVITNDYVHVAVRDAFNWDEVAKLLGEESAGDWFIVAFRSVRKADADSKALYEADAKAHREAIHSGGLLQVRISSWQQNHDMESHRILICSIGMVI